MEERRERAHHHLRLVDRQRVDELDGLAHRSPDVLRPVGGLPRLDGLRHPVPSQALVLRADPHDGRGEVGRRLHGGSVEPLVGVDRDVPAPVYPPVNHDQLRPVEQHEPGVLERELVASYLARLRHGGQGGIVSLLADLGVQLGEALLYLQQAPLLREGLPDALPRGGKLRLGPLEPFGRGRGVALHVPRLSLDPRDRPDPAVRPLEGHGRRVSDAHVQPHDRADHLGLAVRLCACHERSPQRIGRVRPLLAVRPHHGHAGEAALGALARLHRGGVAPEPLDRLLGRGYLRGAAAGAPPGPSCGPAQGWPGGAARSATLGALSRPGPRRRAP